MKIKTELLVEVREIYRRLEKLIHENYNPNDMELHDALSDAAEHLSDFFKLELLAIEDDQSGDQMKSHEVEFCFPLGSQQQWMAVFKHEPSVEEIEAAIEAEKPFAGYGSSSYRKPKLVDNFWHVEILSSASCD